MIVLNLLSIPSDTNVSCGRTTVKKFLTDRYEMIYYVSMKESMKKKKAALPRGRPRSFDIEKALDQALQVFRHKGYEGTSLSDLTEAMGINRPSLYAAFGNKEALFRKTLDRYADGPAGYIRKALEEPTARAVAERLLHGAVDLLTDPRTPRGCLMVQGALSCGESADPIRRELASRRAASEAEVRQRFRRARLKGDLSPDSDPADLARFLATVIHGMSVQAASGASRNELLGVVETALRAWPE
jgi:AcrR family transcriptional regulator